VFRRKNAAWRDIRDTGSHSSASDPELSLSSGAGKAVSTVRVRATTDSLWRAYMAVLAEQKSRVADD
jgi:hypothetical protein